MEPRPSILLQSIPRVKQAVNRDSDLDARLDGKRGGVAEQICAAGPLAADGQRVTVHSVGMSCFLRRIALTAVVETWSITGPGDGTECPMIAVCVRDEEQQLMP